MDIFGAAEAGDVRALQNLVTSMGHAENSAYHLLSTGRKKLDRVDSLSDEGWTALCIAAKKGHFGCVKMLISAGANVNFVHGETSTTPAHLVCEVGFFQCLELLINANADVNDRSPGYTPMANAVWYQHAACVKLLLNQNVIDVNEYANSLFQTPAFLAAYGGSAECLDLLIAHKADVDSFGWQGSGWGTLLAKACENNHPNCALLLIGAGADPTLRKTGASPEFSSYPWAFAGKSPLAIARRVGNDRAAAAIATARVDPYDSRKAMGGHLVVSRKVEEQQEEKEAQTDDQKRESFEWSPNEVLAAAEAGVLEAALPALFQQSPLSALERVAQLVCLFRKEGRRLARLDSEGSDKLSEKLVTAQQMGRGLLGALEPVHVQHLFLEEGADLARPKPSKTIAALVLADCKVLLADAQLQRAIDTLWGVVPPDGVADAVSMALRCLWQFGLIVFVPPYANWLAAERNRNVKTARQGVIERNPLPKKEFYSEGVLVDFKVENRWVSSSYTSKDNIGTWKQATDIFNARREALVDEKEMMEKCKYTVLQPQAKFFISAVALLLLAVFLTALPAEASTWQIVSLLIWTLQLILLETIELFAYPVMWRADPLNSLEFGAAILAALGLAKHLLISSSAMLISGAIVLIFISQSARLLEKSPTCGPLVLMVIRMVGDTFNFLVLIAGTLVGFGCGFVALFKSSTVTLGDDCAVLDDGKGSSGVAGVVVFLLEVMLGSDNQLGCLRDSESVMAVIFMDCYLLIAVLLGCNMLIALMAKTFDVVYEQQGVNFMYLSALLTSAWLEAGVVPPPLTLLGVPYLLFAWIQGKLCTCSFQKLEEEAAGEENHTASSLKVRIPSIHVLRESMLRCVEEHAGQEDANEKWRTSLVKQVAQVAAQVAAIKDEQLRQATRVMEELAKVKEQLVEQK